MKAKKSKGADSGTQYSHWTKNPHEFEDKKEDGENGSTKV